MGMDRSDYIIYGWIISDDSLKHIDFFDDKFLPYVEGHPGEDFCIVRNESTRSVAIGYRIAQNHDDANGWGRGTPLENITRGTHAYVHEKFGELFGFNTNTDPKIFILSTYS